MSTVVEEELGIIDNEFVETYLGEFNGDLRMDTIELSALEYWSVERIETTISQTPEKFTPWFLNEMAYYFQQKKAAR